MTDPCLSRRSPGPGTRSRETATSICTKADKLRKALRSLHQLDRYAIARTVVDQSSEQGRARRALLLLEAEISAMFPPPGTRYRAPTATEPESDES